MFASVISDFVFGLSSPICFCFLSPFYVVVCVFLHFFVYFLFIFQFSLCLGFHHFLPNVFFFGSVISHWAIVFQSGEQEFYRILITIVLVSVTDQYKSLTLAIHNQCVLKPYTCRP